MTPALHITFTEAGADALRGALDLAGRTDRVIALPDDLSVGPVGPADPAARRDWLAAQGIGEDLDITACEAFWRQAMTDGSPRVVWTSRRVAREYAGFLEWLSRNGAARFALVDLTHVETEPGRLARLDLAGPETLLAAGWLDAGRPVSAAARGALTRSWKALADGGAPLRLSRDGDLRPAPLSAFDEILMARASPYWMRLSLIIAMILDGEAADGVVNASSPLLLSRLRALVAEGRLLAEGEIAPDGACNLRRA